MQDPNRKKSVVAPLVIKLRHAIGYDTKLHLVHQNAPTKRDARKHSMCHHDKASKMTPEERAASTVNVSLAGLASADPVINLLLQNQITEGEAVDILKVLTGMVKPPSALRKAKTLLLGRGIAENEPIQGRSTHGKDIDRAMEYLKNYYKQFPGFTVREVPYRKNGKTFKNLEVTIPGSGPAANKVLVLGAHLDSTAGSPWGPEMKAPGADDDGSGTTALMLVARFFHELMKNGKLAHTIRLVHFTGEEQGLWGSNAYSDDVAREVDQKKIQPIAMLAMDMIGYTGAGGNDVEIHDFDDVDRGSRKVSEKCVHMVATYKLKLNATIQKSDHLADRSDQSGFRRHGWAALLISERTVEENPNYHSTNDVLSTLNIEFLVNVARMIGATAADLAGYQANQKAA
jgi:hypothetical protein